MPGNGMNNRLLLLLFCCCLLLCLGPFTVAWAVTLKGDSFLQPRLEIPALVQEIGPVEEGQAMTARFVLANTGTAALHIREIKPGCTCIRVKGPQQLLPGTRADLEMQVNTTNMSGERVFKVSIASDDPERPIMTVVLKARITPLVTLVPDRFFLRGPAGQPLTGEIDIVSRRPEALQMVLEPPSSKEPLQIRLTTITPGRHLRLSLRCTETAAASIRERLVLRTNIPGREHIAVPVLVDLLPPVDLLPSILELRRDRCPACASRFSGSFMIRATNDRPLTLLVIQPELAGLRYKVETLISQQAYRVSVQWEESAAKTSPPSALSVKVHQDEQQILSLPLRIDAAGKGRAELGPAGSVRREPDPSAGRWPLSIVGQ